MRYELLLLTSFKGHLTNDTVSIITGFGHGDCGYNFEVGKEYIVYANDEINIGYGKIKKVPNTFETNICTRTCTLNNLELDLIRKYCRPQRTKGKSH